MDSTPPDFNTVVVFGVLVVFGAWALGCAGGLGVVAWVEVVAGATVPLGVVTLTLAIVPVVAVLLEPHALAASAVASSMKIVRQRGLPMMAS